MGASLRSGILLAIAFVGACAGQSPSGASCSTSGECEPGLQCLYPLGSGCGAKGTCAVPASDCDGMVTGLVLCGCGFTLDLTCVPSSATIAQRTATGAACIADGGGG